MQRFLLPDGADAARYALSARFVAEEAGDAQRHVAEIDAIVEQHHDAGADRRTRRARALDRERQIDLVRPDEDTGRAAEQDRLQRPSVAGTAGCLDQLAKRDAERYLVQSWPRRAAGDAEQFRPGRCPGADSGKRGAASSHDVENVDERFDVVDDRRLAEQSRLNGKRRLVSRLASEALDGVEQRGFLAANVGAAASSQFDIEPDRSVHYAVAE